MIYFSCVLHGTPLKMPNVSKLVSFVHHIDQELANISVMGHAISILGFADI